MSSDGRDPLGDVLALLRPEAVLAAELRAHGRWSLAFDRQPAVKFGVVVEGECLIAVQGRPAKTLRAGDLFLLGGPPPFVLASDLKAPSRNGQRLLSAATARVVRIGDLRMKPITRVIGGHFVLDPPNAHLLAAALPPFVRIAAEEPSPLRELIPLLIEEVRSTQLGRERALDHLAQLVLIETLRRIDLVGKTPHTGWLRALADPQVGAALRHIHAKLDVGTSLPALARVAGMSRTAFAARFKALVGQPPHTYAVQWKMSVAKDALRKTTRAIGALAFELGYASESAFSMAFRREVGCSPRAYRRG
ncbi:MAG: AraC family transcriptional regulator [Myxococcaceae bacterium]